MSVANHPKFSIVCFTQACYLMYQFIKHHWTVKTCADIENLKMFEKLFSKFKIGINMSSSPVDPTTDKKQPSSSSKASKVGKYLLTVFS